MHASHKQTLRHLYQKKRAALSPEDRKSASLKICDQIKQLSLYATANCIGFYNATRNEVDLSSLWKESLRSGKACYFPKINPDQTLSFLRATESTQWVPNAFNILEPLSLELIKPDALDFILIPLVAFDLTGSRIGSGAGYYDRTLLPYPTLQRIGVAYDCQLCAKIPADPWDIPLSMVLTPDRIHHFNQG